MIYATRGLLAAAALFAATVPGWAEEKPAKAKAAPKSVHDFKVKTIEDEDFDLRKLRNRVLLIVNVASR